MDPYPSTDPSQAATANVFMGSHPMSTDPLLPTADIPVGPHLTSTEPLKAIANTDSPQIVTKSLQTLTLLQLIPCHPSWMDLH